MNAEPVATPNFGIHVQRLALGGTQLRLFERDVTPASHHHLGITVDDRLVELPCDVVQLNVRDPADLRALLKPLWPSTST